MKKLSPLLVLCLASKLSFASVTISNNQLSEFEQHSTSGLRGSVGIAAASMPEYVGGDESSTFAIPLINVSYNDRYYIKYNKLGAWLWRPEHQSFRIGGLVTSHQGWSASDGELLEGLTSRDDSILAGVNARFDYQYFSAEAGFITDISDESDGNKFYIQGALMIFDHPTVNVAVTLKIETLDDNLVEYYYGFNDPVFPDIQSYIADSTTNASLGIVGTYQLSPKWTVTGAISSTSFGNEIANSPLVESSNHTTVLVGTSYSF